VNKEEVYHRGDGKTRTSAASAVNKEEVYHRGDGNTLLGSGVQALIPKEPKGPEGLRIVLDQIISNPEELARKRANARAYAEAHFSMKVLAEEWVSALRGPRE
jgi:glycosyltransferase involved in cell wall biosynthesis